MTLQSLQIAMCDQFAFHCSGSGSGGGQTSCCCLKSRTMNTITTVRFEDCTEQTTRPDDLANLHGREE
jgi:hypothetical protein